MTLQNLEQAFQQQVEVDMMIEVMLDWWEEGQEELPGLTKDYVRGAIEYAVSVDDNTTVVLKESIDLYHDGENELVENILSKRNPNSRAIAISRIQSEKNKQLLLELNALLYRLPLAKLVFNDFFTNPGLDTKYKRSIDRKSHSRTPFPILSILRRYSIETKKVEDKGTGNNIYGSLSNIGEDERNRVIAALLLQTGCKEEYQKYNKAKIYWCSDHVEKAKKILQHFLNNKNTDIKYHRLSCKGQPYSLPSILRHYSVEESRIVSNGDGNCLYNHLVKIPGKQRQHAIDELVERTGLKERYDDYAKTKVYWTSGEVELARKSLHSFFNLTNEETKYMRHGGHKHGSEKGKPYSLETILHCYSIEQEKITRGEGSASSLYFGGFRRIPNKERQQAIEELLEKTGFKDIYKEYSKTRIYWFSDEIDLARKIFSSFLNNPDNDVKYQKDRPKGSGKRMPYSVEGILLCYSIENRIMDRQGDGTSLYSRLNLMGDSDRKAAVEALLEKTGLKESYGKYAKTSIFWTSEEILMVKKVFDHFFTDVSVEDRYKNRRDQEGSPYPVRTILRCCSIAEKNFCAKGGISGDARSLNDRLNHTTTGERDTAILNLLEETGYKEIFKEYTKSNIDNPFHLQQTGG